MSFMIGTSGIASLQLTVLGLLVKQACELAGVGAGPPAMGSVA